MANHYQSLILSIVQQLTEQAWLEFKHKFIMLIRSASGYRRLPMALIWLTRSNDKQRKNKVRNLLQKMRRDGLVVSEGWSWSLPNS